MSQETKQKDYSRKGFLRTVGMVTAGAVIGGPILTLAGCEDALEIGVADGTVEAVSYPLPYQKLNTDEVQPRTWNAYMEGG